MICVFRATTEPHCDNNQIWRLNKCVNGLTSLMWFKRVEKFVNENNETSPITDPALLMINLLE